MSAIKTHTTHQNVMICFLIMNLFEVIKQHNEQINI